MSAILSGVRVLDFCWIGAGALVTQTLALHGAEVIKIESRHRPDGLRLSPPYRPGTSGLEASGYFASRNAGKKSFALNMSHPDGPATARRLLDSCSVLTSNYRPGVLERWGLDYDRIAPERPDLIFLSMPMQGEKGPHRDYLGFGSTIAALSGLVAPSGLPGRTPIGTGTHYPDHVPNPGHALVALLAAMLYRKRTGRGGRIELAQFESTVNMVGPSVIANSATGFEPEPAGNHTADRTPRGVYPCLGTEQWCAISVADQAQWTALCQALDLPGLADDVRFATPEDRRANEHELDQRIGWATARFDAHELAQTLQARGVPASRVQSPADVLDDPVLAGRGYWHVREHAVIGSLRVAAGPYVWSDGDMAPATPAPLLGADTEQLARDLLGLDRDEVARLVEQGLLQ
ncbi:MAG TPA: CoA transferase [Rugosimonospora sp.]|nr:CoA transferase [Rugosimonospora sp.]